MIDERTGPRAARPAGGINATKPELTLVSHHLCPYVQRAVITLVEKDVEHQRVYIDLADKPDWFRDISPLGKVPVLIAGDATLFESAVICEYLEETSPKPLHPADPVERAVHRAWIELASSTLDAIAGFYNASDAASFENRRAVLRDRLEWLEGNLGKGPFFAGERFHLVDAAWGPVFRYFDTFERIDDFGLLDDLERVADYRRALAVRESVRAAVPAGYPGRLHDFLARRGTHLSRLMTTVAA